MASANAVPYISRGNATARRHGIPTIGFGPQHEIYAHQTNEVVPVDALIKPSLTEPSQTRRRTPYSRGKRDGVVPSSQPTTFYAAIPGATAGRAVTIVTSDSIKRTARRSVPTHDRRLRGNGKTDNVVAMEISRTLYVTDRVQWRAWLKKHHRTVTGIWLIYYKKHTGMPRIPYDDAVEEALCFGWIDSTIKRLDDERFMQQFTPRTNHKSWSDSNIRRVRKMIEQGKMTEAGLAKFDCALLDRKPRPKPKLVLPAHVKRALMANRKAWTNFSKLAPSYRRNYIAWLGSAKGDETFRKRVREAIRLLARNVKLGMK